MLKVIKVIGRGGGWDRGDLALFQGEGLWAQGCHLKWE